MCRLLFRKIILPFVARWRATFGELGVWVKGEWAAERSLCPQGFRIAKKCRRAFENGRLLASWHPGSLASGFRPRRRTSEAAALGSPDASVVLWDASVIAFKGAMISARPGAAAFGPRKSLFTGKARGRVPKPHCPPRLIMRFTRINRRQRLTFRAGTWYTELVLFAMESIGSLRENRAAAAAPTGRIV